MQFHIISVQVLARICDRNFKCAYEDATHTLDVMKFLVAIVKFTSNGSFCFLVCVFLVGVCFFLVCISCLLSHMGNN